MCTWREGRGPKLGALPDACRAAGARAASRAKRSGRADGRAAPRLLSLLLSTLRTRARTARKAGRRSMAPCGTLVVHGRAQGRGVRRVERLACPFPFFRACQVHRPISFPCSAPPPRPRGASRTPLPYEARIRGTGARSAPSARARARGRRRGGWGSPSGEKAFPEFSFAFGLSSDLPPRLTWSRHRGSRGYALGLQHGLWLPEGSRGPVMEPTYGVCRGCQDVEATSQRLACGGTWHTPCAQPPTG